MPFTLFIYPKIAGRGAHAVTWRQIEELASGDVDVENHMATHPFLTALDATSLGEELANSREAIAAHTGKAVRFLSYPYGDYNPAVIDAAARDGYDAAVTTWGGPITCETRPLELRRFLLHNDTTLEEFKTFL